MIDHIPKTLFEIEEHQRELDELNLTANQLAGCNVVATTAPFAMVIVLVIGGMDIRQMPLTFALVCGIGLFSVLCGALSWRKQDTHLMDRSEELHKLIDLCRGNRKHYAYFSKRDSQWAKLSNPMKEIEHFCRMNSYPVRIAADEGFTQVHLHGVHVSFDDPEHLLMFNMKFMDKF